MKYKELASDILEDVGGSQNIDKVIHCATRLRFTLKDDKKADADEIKEMRGVSGVVNSNGQFQVIIGPDVASVYDELMKLGVNSGNNQSQDESQEKKKLFDRVLDFIGSCFTPVVAVITAGGMLQVLLSILVKAGVMADTNDTYLVLYQVSQAAFFFLPVYLGYSVAAKLKIDPVLGMMLGGMLVLPDMTSLLATEGGVTLFGISVPDVTYSSSVVPIILGVWFMSYVYKLADRYIPNFLKFILRPLVTIVIAAPVTLLILGPLGTYIGNYLAKFLSFLMDGYAPIAVMIMGAFAQLIVMTGMHYALVPILIASFSAYGYDSLIMTGMMVGIAAETGVCLAVALKSKNPRWRQLGFSTAITSFMGISEPALYGVTLKLKKPLIAVIISGAVGGLYTGITGVKAYVMIASFASLPTFFTTTSNLVNECIAVGITVVIAFILTWFLVKKSDLEDGKTSSKTKENDRVVEEKSVMDDKSSNTSLGHQEKIMAATDGQVVPLDELSDAAFGSGALGKGGGILSSTGQVKAPVSGQVTALFPTKHAVGLIGPLGIEILIHIGVDTVNMNGEGFTAHVEVGQKVEQGDLLIDFDQKLIREKGYDPVVIMVVTNTDNFLDVIATDKKTVTTEEGFITVIK